jgi:RNA polymerase sigma-70 factor (ECF subfamily)
VTESLPLDRATPFGTPDRAVRSEAGGASIEDLVRRARAGSPAAFGELVERFESPVFNFLLRRGAGAEDAEELAQDTFVRAWRRLDLYDPRWSFATWLFALARRLSATRSRRSAPAIEGGDALGDVPVQADPAREVARTEERASLWSIAERVLEDDPLSALWLRYAEDLSIEEIARVLGRSQVSVRVILFRARAKLGKALEPARSGSSAFSGPAETTQWRKAGI